MPSSSSESVTVTVLPDVLGLVHIPRSRLKYFSHHVVKQLLTPGPSFLNITCNKIELSLFADQSILAEFEPLARKDRQRLRRSASLRRTRSRSHSIWSNDPVEVSYDTWNVLQIDSHDDRLDKAGARVRELSAPLADAGLSILYQSSYMSDFIFVKSSRLNHVLARLAHAGFVGYSFDITSQLSPIISTPSSHNDDVDQIFMLDSQSDLRNSSDTVSLRKSTDPTSIPLILQRDEIPIPARHASPVSETATVTPTPPASVFSRRRSIPCGRDVQILDPELACVGLAEACAETWSSKIIKLVAYPELISSAKTPVPDHVVAPFDNVDLPPSLDDSAPYCINLPPSFPAPDFWSSASSSDSGSSIGTSPPSSEDGYFSSASPYSTSSSSLSMLSSSRSYPELSDTSSSRSSRVHLRPRPRLSRLDTVTGPVSAPPSATPAQDPREKNVPFFSFTRTAEGSSLTTGLELVATMFPPSERHMVICGDELGLADESLEREGWMSLQSGAPSPVSSTMKCLQIDLQKFGLDKHGLISRFSKVLDSNGINHMYSSTYKTANLLVDRADAARAQALLRSC